MEVHFRRLTIIGVGLIGGSLARVCRKKGLADELVGVGRGRKNLELAVELGVIDRWSHEVEEGVDGADGVVLATPMGTIIPLAKRMAPHIEAGCLVTDVGSTKASVVEPLERLLQPSAAFVGGHPIAGTEKSGVEASFETLFEGFPCILTPTDRTDTEALARVQSLWEACGMSVVCMDPDTHDTLMAGVSHLPHMVAYALINTVTGLSSNDHDAVAYSAGGFRDFTRIAASDPTMWRDICLTNREPLLAMIDRFSGSLAELREAIEGADGEAMQELFAAARRIREGL
ncbi:MAG: prephenate dehydrogenase/arogenate dehydrogenase family protein [Nitrospinae bacterium]|nr:prephenate dehydrogenase/arogenate dehydrogenase family protein [Nitrospinota bacterium]